MSTDDVTKRHFDRYDLFWFGMGFLLGGLIVGTVATLTILGMK